MSKVIQVAVIRGSITAADARRLVSSLTGDCEATLEPDVIYPYYRFDVRSSVPTLAGRKDVSQVCLVDAVNGLGATADSFELETETVPATQVLRAGLGADAAGDVARRVVTHGLGRKLRMIASFGVSVVPRGKLYKRFWIVRTGTARVMVDSTTGNLHPLKQRAA